MKQIFKTWACVLATTTIAVFAASCAKDNLSEEAQNYFHGVKRTITSEATLPNADIIDKAYIDEANGRKVKWETDDQLNVNGTFLSFSHITGDGDGTTANFSGTVYAIDDHGNDVYWAVYPIDIAEKGKGEEIPRDYTPTTLLVNLTLGSIYNTMEPFRDIPMVAYASVPAGSTNIKFNMRNICSVIKLNLQPKSGNDNNLVKKIVLSSSNGVLRGNFTIDNDLDNPSLTLEPGSGVEKITIGLTDGTNNYIDISSGATVYIAIPPMASKNLHIKIINTDGHYTEKDIASVTLVRNRMYTSTISNIDFENKVYTMGGHIFAPGNLQCSATGGGSTPTTHTVAGGGTADGTWRFAPNQWDVIGSSNANASSTYTGWIDLFGWGTSGYDNKYPYLRTVSVDAYPQSSINNSNYDWGVYNAIYNPKTNTTDPAGTWKTVDKSIWKSILTTRSTPSGIRYAKANVHGVNGLLILPDNWKATTYALNNTNEYDAAFNTNVISDADWTTIENAGAIFLPTTGQIEGHVFLDINNNYWSSNIYVINNSGYVIYFDNTSANLGCATNNELYVGAAVRLIKDYIE